MTKLLEKLTKFFKFAGSVSTDLDRYIISKNPQSVSEVEFLTRKYLNGGICRRIV